MTKTGFLALVVLVALMAAFVVLLMKKWGITEWLQINGDKYLSQMAACDFCLSFWTSTVLWVVLACWYDNPLLVVCGVFSCPLTRYMV